MLVLLFSGLHVEAAVPEVFTLVPVRILYGGQVWHGFLHMTAVLIVDTFWLSHLLFCRLFRQIPSLSGSVLLQFPLSQPFSNFWFIKNWFRIIYFKFPNKIIRSLSRFKCLTLPKQTICLIFVLFDVMIVIFLRHFDPLGFRSALQDDVINRGYTKQEHVTQAEKEASGLQWAK